MSHIENAFITEGTSVYDFFQKPGLGLYIPLYQRQYSWDNDNIEQLLDDISRGIESLIESDDELRFLGTIITVVERNPNNIQPLDRRGLPTIVWLVIDGQQRLSTISLFACLLHKTMNTLSTKIPNKYPEIKEELAEIAEEWKKKLLDLFSFDLNSGVPPRKPKIIRQSEDKWVKEGDIDTNYKTAIANYIAQFIQYIHGNGPDPSFSKDNKVGKNLDQIQKWLNTIVLKAHTKKIDDFPDAISIIEGIKQENIWRYERPNLANLVETIDLDGSSRSINHIVAAFVQLSSVCHYLLYRCCFTSIQPINDKWAFDMFQSLNATGTPLTAIETFKPFVVNITNLKEENFKGSQSEKSFDKLESLFKGTRSASRKNKLTSDFLASFSTTVDGKAVSSHFSQQRKWLDSSYKYYDNTPEEYSKKCEFVENLGYHAEFYKKIWLDYSGVNNTVIGDILSDEEGELASVLILYLKESGHKMAITILAIFYKEVLKGSENSIVEFISVVKTIAAFYTIWRSARSNSGLDNIYRQYFKGVEDTDKAYNLSSHIWKSKTALSFTSKELKEYFKYVLQREGLAAKKDWKTKAARELNYKDANKICRFGLIATFHETIVDEMELGLIKQGTIGTKKYLTLENWNSDELKTIEHVAPQTNPGYWDKLLYGENDLYQKIGNLTLLPESINKSAGNKSWAEKLLYYKHLSEKDPTRQKELANKAAEKGIKLNPSTIEKLQKSKYNDHIQSIVALGEKGQWDADFVKKRTDRILDILWDRINTWIFK